jgi:hypothetical protein
MPRDPMVNLWMGELYEQSGKLTRSWSRYVQAAISDDAPSEALVGLDRLNRNPLFRASFTMTDAEQLLEGRILEFHPADRHRPDGGAASAPGVRLVELFTCVDHAETVAPELAFGGLRDYFEHSDVAFVEYHLAVPEADPLASEVSASRAEFYELRGTPAACFNGGSLKTEGGNSDDVEAIFSAYKSVCLQPQSAAGPWRLDGRVSVARESITGELELTGPQGGETLRLHAILCEKAVMVPGANGLLMHRQVARSASSPARGLVVPTGAGRRTFEIRFDTGEVRASLERMLDALEKERAIEFLMKPTYVDAASCEVVAFLQDDLSKQVLAARAFEVRPSSEPEPRGR